METLSKLKIIESERLILRPLTLKDSKSLFDYARIADITKYVFWDPHKTLKDSKKFIKETIREYKVNNKLMWGVQLKGQQGIIGTCGFMAYYRAGKTLEVGYAFNPKYWGKGYAKEALNTIINYTFNNLDIIRIEGVCVNENNASAKTMMSCNMNFEGVLQDSFIKGEEIYNCKMFSITRRNWEKNISN